MSALEHGDDVVGHRFDRHSAAGCDGFAHDRAVVGRNACDDVVAEFAQHWREGDEVGPQQGPDASVGVVAAFVVEGPRRCEFLLEPLHAKLEQALWANDVLQPELAQVTELELGAFEVLDDPGGCVRDKDLAPVSGGADSRCSMDAEAELALTVQKRLRGMEAHPDSELHALRPLDSGEPTLHVDRSRHRVGCTVESGEVGVTLRVDDVALVSRTRVLDQTAVLRADSTVLGSQGA